MTKKYFGTDGIRGTVNKGNINGEMFFKFGLATGVYFKNQNLTSNNYLKFAKKLGIPANYPRLKGLSSKYTKITVVERKTADKGPSFGEQFHTDSIYTKNPPRFTMLLSKLVPKKGQANTEFSSQYLSLIHI